VSLPLQPHLDPPSSARRAAVIVALLVVAGIWIGAAEEHRGGRVLTNHHPGDGHYLTTVSRMISSAQDRIRVLQYVVRPSDTAGGGLVGDLLQQLVVAQRRGVDVHVILDHSPRDGQYPGPDNSAAAAILVAGGVPVAYDEIDIRSHAKLVLVDDRAVVGSHNWTYSALTGNREISLLVEDPRAVADLERILAAIATIEPVPAP
jgi:phosphatidylserine/phosphatidylglycerophosphate/cardiolipin synthase-like enzyme